MERKERKGEGNRQDSPQSPPHPMGSLQILHRPGSEAESKVSHPTPARVPSPLLRRPGAEGEPTRCEWPGLWLNSPGAQPRVAAAGREGGRPRGSGSRRSPSRAQPPGRADPLVTRPRERPVRPDPRLAAVAPGPGGDRLRGAGGWGGGSPPPRTRRDERLSWGRSAGTSAEQAGAREQRAAVRPGSPGRPGSPPLPEDTLPRAPGDAGSSQRPSVTSPPFARSRSPGFRDAECWRGGRSRPRRGRGINNRTGYTTPWTVTSPSQEKINNI